MEYQQKKMRYDFELTRNISGITCQAFLAGRPRASWYHRALFESNRNPAPEINSLNPGSHHSISAPTVHC